VITGINQLRARFQSVGNTELLLRELQFETVAGAKAKVPRKTGHLGRSILPGHVSRQSAQVTVNANYAAAVELGTKRHTIVPKRARVLAWPSTEGGRRLSGRARTGKAAGPMAFAAKVNHPGTKAQPYLVPAAKDAVKRHGVEVVVDLWNKGA
jgi:hypothetical protein